MEEIIQNQGPEMVPAADAEQQERMRRDVREFVNEFPGVKATDIAPEVWTEVRSGKSLVSAYRGHRERQLRQENLSIQQIAEQNGFSSASAFSRMFHNQYGISPAAYRKRSR